ncbi:MAG: DUF3540 domain-containing protein [Polyangiaceae bacterium]
MSVAKKLAVTGTFMESGSVERVEGATIEVALPSGRFQAARAKSCLVEPDRGDRVLCAIEADRVFVLAVLEGQPNTVVAADGDLSLVSRSGRASITSPKGVDVETGGEVLLAGREIHARARHGTVAIEELGFFGKLVQAEVGKIALVANEVDSFMTRMTQRAKRVFRVIDEIDQTRANTIDMRAETVLGLRGENAIVSARVITKLDAEQVHIG